MNDDIVAEAEKLVSDADRILEELTICMRKCVDLDTLNRSYLAELKDYAKTVERLSRENAELKSLVDGRKQWLPKPGCKITRYSSRTCERGTKSCEVAHD